MKSCARVVIVLACLFGTACFDGNSGVSTGNGMFLPTPPLNGGVDTGNGIQIDLAAEAVSSYESPGGYPQGPDALDTLFTVHGAILSVHHVELELPRGMRCGNLDDLQEPVSCVAAPVADHLIINGPFVADLMSVEMTPEIEPILPALYYPSATIVLYPADAADGVISAGDPTEGQAFLADGCFRYQEEEHTFSTALSFDDTIESGPVDLTGAEKLWVDLLVESWFANLPITGCLNSGDLPLQANHLALQNGQGACAAVELLLENNLVGATQVFGGPN